MKTARISPELQKFMQDHGNKVKFVPVKVLLKDAVSFPALAGPSIGERGRAARAIQEANKKKFRMVLEEIETLADTGERDGEMSHICDHVYCQLSLSGIERLSKHPDVEWIIPTDGPDPRFDAEGRRVKNPNLAP